MDIRRYFRLNVNERPDTAGVNQIENAIETLNENAVVRDIENLAQDTENLLMSEIVSIEPNGIISEEDFEFVPGKRKTSKLLFLKKEKCLYLPTSKDKIGTRYRCYTTSCSARAVIRLDGSCEKAKRNFLHAQHKNHLDLKQRFVAENKIKKTCGNVEELCAGSSQNVSVKDIFDRETIR